MIGILFLTLALTLSLVYTDDNPTAYLEIGNINSAVGSSSYHRAGLDSRMEPGLDRCRVESVVVDLG